jgi:hypothetical protein
VQPGSKQEDHLKKVLITCAGIALGAGYLSSAAAEDAVKPAAQEQSAMTPADLTGQTV